VVTLNYAREFFDLPGLAYVNSTIVHDYFANGQNSCKMMLVAYCH
jgi:hypothetical protein